MRKLLTIFLTFIGIIFLCVNAKDKGIIITSAIAAEPDAALSAPASEDNSMMAVHFIDVGQGDATLISCGNEHMLIDAGNNDCGLKVWKYLSDNGVDKLKYVIGTHPDADHIGGLDVIIYRFDVENILMPDIVNDTPTYYDVVSTAALKGYDIIHPYVGMTFTLGNATFTVIAPNGVYEDTNDYSIGIKLTHGSNDFVLIGDAEEASETDMLMTGMDLSAEVYKVAHHGSYNGSIDPFLDAVHPTYAVISCGYGNDYEHPHNVTLNRLKERGISVFRTDEQGTIIAISDGQFLAWNNEPSITWQSGVPVQNDYSSVEGSTGIIPEGTTFVLNNNSKKIHLPYCESVGDMAEYNKEYTTLSAEELIACGYSPCGRCMPG